ncbi:MAG: hypothetical protein ABII10_01940 [Candidatus Paceibacterota bacterium]
MVEKELTSIESESAEETNKESVSPEVNNFEIKARNKELIGQTVAEYVSALTAKLEFSPEKIKELAKLPPAEQLASLVEKPEGTGVNLKIKRGPRTWAISSDAEFGSKIDPEAITLQAQLALALEAAARFQVVAENLPKEGVFNQTNILRAKSLAKKAEKAATDLIFENREPKAIGTKLRALTVTLFMLFAAACAKVVVPNANGINNTEPLITYPDNNSDIGNLPPLEGQIPEENPDEVIDQEPTPTIKPTEAIAPTPESFTSQQSSLKLVGYTIQATEDGTQLVNAENKVVIASTEVATVSITTATGETLKFPQEAFEGKSTTVAGVEYILTIKNAEGEVAYFFLEKTSEWVTPLEIQTNARELENYPEIDLADIESGRALISEALKAEPFPEGTLVLDDLYYFLSQGLNYDYNVQLVGITNGTNDNAWNAMEGIIKQNTDPRRWTNFYRTVTPEGKEAIIGTQQMLLPDGKTSVFFHYIFGPEWPWEEDYQPGNQSPRNLINSVFLAQTVPNDPNTRISLTVRPIVHVEYSDFTGSISGEFIGSDAISSAPDELYHSDGGPIADNSELLAKFNASEAEIKKIGFVGPATFDEINHLQFEPLMQTNTQFPMGYFTP